MEASNSTGWSIVLAVPYSSTRNCVLSLPYLSATQTHIAPILDAPQRLSDYAIGVFQACMTKSALKKLLKKGLIIVDKEPANTATWIKGGEKIVYRPQQEVKPRKELVFPLEVLYEDEHLAVVHKPAGILVSGNGFKTIVNALPQSIKRSSLSDATATQPIHRLDYATTGVLLVGKTSSSIVHLSRQFQEKRVIKTYYAITIGSMGALGSICYRIDNKPAQTDFEVVDSVPSPRFGCLNLVRVSPKTGRRHQIRKHMAHIGSPILGDKDYGLEGLILNGKGLYLHAHSLSCYHPVSENLMTFHSPLPVKFHKIFPDASLLN